MNNTAIQAVPTNIITGFLGVGKTSAILHLLKSKPDNERWAVLVNEFGEIGVDGSLFEGQHTENNGVFIREVPGGCMCCAAGLPMQIALNQLLSQAKPDRLLIEPTGLGHPKEVLQILSADYYQEILSLQKTLTLVDARKLSDPQYTNHDTFNQQITIADTIIGNKVDLYDEYDKFQLSSYIKQHAKPDTEIILTQQGQFDLSVLSGPTSWKLETAHHHHHHAKKDKVMASDAPIPESGFLKAQNEGEGFKSAGWRFSPDKVFDHNKLLGILTGIQTERLKAVFITESGVFGYNLTNDGMTEFELDDCAESRIEIIATELSETLEDNLLACLVE
ncbi:GTP-binding protein [Photobacterium sanctipauli]|uniref:GTP-binding protein n=1 Tax=Photobacterium sanctipauli TaxID=1342794 RepID=A0A2T3NND9_9GAMM|nr:GTP-binding protein [Photobacterium sanctipauli]PSW17219.1 GTP-binding protein [Photobacterium sanctipauli]